MVDLLSSATLSGYFNANKILGATAFGTSGLTRQEEIIRTGQQEKITVDNQRTGKPRIPTEGLDKIVSFLSNVIYRTKLIRELTDSLNDDVRESDQFGTGDSATHFDSTLAYLSNVATQTVNEPNLLNSSEDKNFKFFTLKDNRVINLSAANLGTGFTITDSKTTIGSDYTTLERSSNIIYSDHEYGVLRQKDPLRGNFSTKLPSLPGNFVSVFGDVRLDSIDKFDPNKVTVTFFPGTNAENSFTGTVSREGLGILNSFLYDSFTTATGRGRAFEDLRVAKTSIDRELLRFEGALKSVTLIKGQKDLSLANFVSLIDTSTIGSAIKLQEADSAWAFKNNFNSIRINGVETSRNELGKMLGALDLDSRSNRIIDLIA